MFLFTFAKLFLLALDGSEVWLGDSRDGWRWGDMNAGAETSVLLFKLGDSAFEVGELCLSAVARVLSGYSVTVCTSLFSLLGGDGGTRAFTGKLVGGTRAGSITGTGGRSGTLEGRGREG